MISVINLDPSKAKRLVVRDKGATEFFAQAGHFKYLDYGGAHTMRVGDGDHIKVCAQGCPTTSLDFAGRPYKDYNCPRYEDCVCPDFHVKPGDIYIYKGGCRFLSLNGYDWNEPGMAAQFCSALADEEKPHCMMHLVCAMVNLHWASDLPNGVKGSYSVIPGQADDWQMLDEEYAEGIGGQNRCRDEKEQPLTKEECEQLPDKVDGSFVRALLDHHGGRPNWLLPLS